VRRLKTCLVPLAGLALVGAPASAANMEWVTMGRPGNAAEAS